MNTVLPVPGFHFDKNLSLLNGVGSLAFEVSGARPDVLAALAVDNVPFGPNDVDLLDTRVRASTEHPIEFVRGADAVSFSAQASAFAGLGVYRTGGALLQRLGAGADDFALNALEFGVGAGTLLAVLRWGYAADAKGNGSVALGAVGAATLAASGNGEGLFAVIRRFPANRAARSIVQGVADSWIMPRQITSIDQVEPGTWLVSEVTGGLSITLGAQVGYDFSWVREAAAGGLTGDIGLRLQMGIEAAIGYSSSGRCAVVVSRESDAPSLRLRFFRLKTRAFDVSFDASLGVEASETLLPARIDDFIAAVFDTHGQQILNDLQVLEKWTDPNADLPTLLADAGIDGAERLIARLAGVATGALQQSFDAVHNRAIAFITRWHGLPHAVASTVLKFVEEKVDLAAIRDVMQRVSVNPKPELASLLDTQLNRIDFFQTPIGRLLESIAGGGVLSLVGRPDELGSVASRLLGVLDGGRFEQTLRDFQGFVETELHLDKATSAVTATDFAALDGLLRQRLAKFLGQSELKLADLDKIRASIDLLLKKSDEFYGKALDALHRKYAFSLTAASQSTVSDHAMFDATFDFSRDPAVVQRFLQQALQGKLDDLMTAPPAQVTIGAGQISHGITRQAHVDVSLPFFDISQSHLNESLATVDAVPHEGGLLFKVKSSDTVTSSNRRKSALSLATGLSKAGGTDVRLHHDSLELNYSLLFARRRMTLDDVRAQVGPALPAFFSTRIPDGEAYLQSIDRRVEDVVPNGPNLLADGLLSLDLSLPAGAAATIGRAWLALPADRRADAYSNLSTAIQGSLKQNIHDSAFGSRDAYTSHGVVRTQLFLAYCALAPTAQRDLDWFWNWPDNAERRRLLDHPSTLARMRLLLQRAQNVLGGDFAAKDYRLADAATILGRVAEGDPFLNTLLASESQIVGHALKGGQAIAASQKASPSEAVKALATFGAQLTEAFNADVTTLLGAGMQSLGTRVFLAASAAINGSSIAEPDAMLSLEFLKPGAVFDASALLLAGHLSPDQLVFADRIVALRS